MRRITTLQWAVGAFCALLGALMLVAPHQFGGPAFAPLHGLLSWLGATLVFAGAAIIGCVILGMPRRYVVAAHFLAGAVLLVFGPTFAVRGAWNGLAQFTILGAGSALSAFAPRSWSEERRQGGDLFAGLVGLVATVNGSLILLSPKLFSAPIYDAIRPQLPLFGLAFLVAGLAVFVAQLFPAVPSLMFRLAHLSILVPSLSFALVDPIPNRIWTDVFFHVGFSLLVASLPWTGPRLRRIDPRAFSVRLAFTLAVVAALPLIVITWIATSGQEQQVRGEVERDQLTLAGALADNVSEHIGSYRRALVTLADYPGLLDLPPAAQQAVLRSYHEAYPEVVAFNAFDAEGRGSARSDGQPPTDIGGREPFEKVRRTNAPSVSVALGRVPQQPVFAFFQPVRQANGSLIGVAGASLESQRVASLLNRASPVEGQAVYIVDPSGRVMAHPDRTLVADFADLSATPPVAALLAAPAERGVVSYAGPSGGVLAAYARVRDLGWAVVTDQPEASALAPVRSARDTAFGLLLGAILLAVTVGVLVARRLAGPLAALSLAAGRLAHGDSLAPLPRGGSGEIEALVDSFGEMRDKLAARAAERERLLAELGTIFASLAAPVIVFDSECRPVRTNPAAVARYGIDPVSAGMEEFVRKAAIRTSEGVALRTEDLPGVQAVREKRAVTKRLVTTDSLGKEVVVQVVASPLVVDGQVQGAVGVWHDITERERLLATVQESEVRYRSLFTSMSEALIVFRILRDEAGVPTDLRYLDFNPAFEKIVGFSRDRELGMTMSSLVPEAVPDYLRIAARVVDGGEPVRVERYSERFGTWSEANFYSPGEDLLAVLATDNTERKRAETERERLLGEVGHRATELEAVVESTQAQLALLDRDMRFLMVNSAYERGSGHRREELIGRNHFDLFPHAENQTIFERVRDSGVPHQVIEKPFEFEDQPERGIIYWNWVLVPIRDEQGQTRELLLSLLDVTEQVRARQAVEAAVKVRDEFLSIAAHELKTPVTSLRGFSQILLRRHRRTGIFEPDQVLHALTHIDEQTRRLSALTEELLSVSRLEAGRLGLARRETVVRSVVKSAIASVREVYPARTFLLRSSETPRASLDPPRMEQVMVNLLDNAAKFSSMDTPVEIEVSVEGPDEVVISVRDHGPGIAEEDRERVFERFYQAHPEQHYGGMGLGLYISREFVRMHGGTIVCEAPEGGGARFVVRLPLGGGDGRDD